MSVLPRRVRCRRIEPADLGAVVHLLTQGFKYSAAFWHRAFQRLASRQCPAGYPRFGYMLDSGGEAVGVIPLIFATVAADGRDHVRCNVSSWYVAPQHRSQASMLASLATRDKAVTYLVMTPHPQVLPILAAQGYERYCDGRFIATPLLNLRSDPCRVVAFDPHLARDDGLSPEEAKLLADHQQYGCLSVVCRVGERRYPFVLAVHRKLGVLRFASLVYCRDQDDFVRFARPLGRYLARFGIAMVALDASGPIRGLTGRYADGHPNLFKGPDRPRLGDLAYSKRIFFGV